MGIVDGFCDKVQSEEIAEAGKIFGHFMLAGQADDHLGDPVFRLHKGADQFAVIGRKDFCLHKRGGGMVRVDFSSDGLACISMKNQTNHCVKYAENCYLPQSMTIIPLSAKRAVLQYFSYFFQIIIRFTRHVFCIREKIRTISAIFAKQS